MTDSEIPIYVLGGLGVLIGVMCVTVFVLISRYIGSTNRWNEIQDRTRSIWFSSITGSLFLFLAAFASNLPLC